MEMTNEYIDFKNLTTKAYSFLIAQKTLCSFPINPKCFAIKNLIIDTFQNYSRITGVPISELTSDSILNDGYTTKNLRPSINLILYNEEIYAPRMYFTLTHEIGHINLEHIKHGDFEELETNFYSSQILAPTCILKELVNRGYPITTKFLREAFALSEEAAVKKANSLSKILDYYYNELDEIILFKFSNLLSQFPTLKPEFSFEEDWNKRQSWGY